ncbi:MAG: pyridoxamine 5-phosphate oxidase [Acidimicrobiales bacterium]|nr:pyridoxamine 5-phosphate oxidase [Acidimicrobiales bacterium]
MVFDPTHIVADVQQLRTLYRMPHQLVIDKERPLIDDATREFIVRSPFVLVATVGGDGTADVSPRGGPSGFVQVLDDTHVAIADLSGNNRLDTLENIVTNGEVGLLFVMPGHGETVRLNGRACLSTEPTILQGFTVGLKPPKVAIVVEVTGTYIHCAKAMQRSRIWDPASWDTYADAPDGAEILVAQQVVASGVTAEMVRADLDTGYARDLANERA